MWSQICSQTASEENGSGGIGEYDQRAVQAISFL